MSTVDRRMIQLQKWDRAYDHQISSQTWRLGRKRWWEVVKDPACESGVKSSNLFWYITSLSKERKDWSYREFERLYNDFILWLWYSCIVYTQYRSPTICTIYCGYLNTWQPNQIYIFLYGPKENWISIRFTVGRAGLGALLQPGMMDENLFDALRTHDFRKTETSPRECWINHQSATCLMVQLAGFLHRNGVKQPANK